MKKTYLILFNLLVIILFVSIGNAAWAGLTVISPEPGSIWRKGDSLYIGWIYPFTNARVLTLELYKDDQFERTIGSANGIGEFYPWKIPSSLEEGYDYKVKVTEPGGQFGYSGSFTVYEASVSSESVAISTFQQFQTISENGIHHLTHKPRG